MKIGIIGILNEEYKTDLWGTFGQLATIGYKAIEGGESLLEGDVSANIARLKGLGMEVQTASASVDHLRNNLPEVIVRAKALEAPRVTVWWSACTEKETILADAELYNHAGKLLAEEGITLCYHHHAHEFINQFDGVCALDWLATHTDPKFLAFNIDIAWVFAGGEDPKRILSKMHNRVPVIHIKDVASPGPKPEWTAIGTGLVGVADVVRHAETLGIPWGIVEQDSLRNLSAIETATFSFNYLKESGIVKN